MIHRNRFLDYVDRFRSARVLVVGPAVIETDVSCEVTHLAPDRAMPVYRVLSQSQHPGGAALTAATIRNLGAAVSLMAPVGSGEPGKALRGLLEDLGVALIEAGNGSCRTPEMIRYEHKTRQLLQLRRGWMPGIFENVNALLKDLEPFDCICVVDSKPGSLDTETLNAITTIGHTWGVPVVFDAAGAMTPIQVDASSGGWDHLIVNDPELHAVCRQFEITDDDAVARLSAVARQVVPHVLGTFGAKGGVLGSRSSAECSVAGENDVTITKISTPTHAMSDRRGVGFVLSGVYSLAVSNAVRAEPEEAAYLACGAASLAAASPGPKKSTIDDLLKMAYREIESHVADGLEVFGRIARDHLPVVDRAARLLLQAYTEGKQVLVFGNGGSAAEANHLVTELTGKFKEKRKPLPAISLSSNDSLATCIANDYGFDELFSRQVTAFCRPNDIVIGMSTSGTSPNVVQGLKEARRCGGKTIAFTGENPRDMAEWSDLVLAVPSNSTARIQEAHLFVIHVMCDMLDRRLDAKGRLHPAASEI